MYWQCYLVVAWLVPRENAAGSAHVLCTPYSHATLYSVTSFSHICRVHACLAVTFHLHFWQNDRDLLRLTAVTRGWNEYRNKSQRRKLILEKKILPPLQLGFEPGTFRSRVRCSNHWATPGHRLPQTRLSALYFYNTSFEMKTVYTIWLRDCLKTWKHW